MPVTQIAVVPASSSASAAGGKIGESTSGSRPTTAPSHKGPAVKCRSQSERRRTTTNSHVELRTLSSPATAMPFVVCQSSSYLPGSVTSPSSSRPSTGSSISRGSQARNSTGSRNKTNFASSSRGGGSFSQPWPKRASIISTPSLVSSQGDICRICHCEGEEEMPLIHPCLCLGSLQFVHQACIQQWIKSSNTKNCELCRFEFIMQSKLKPLGKWEKLDMSPAERRKIICSVSFHLIAVTCVIWALYVLIDKTSNEIQDDGMQWPFWTKLVVVAVGFTGGLVFMYVQCKVYVHLWRRLKAYNRVIYVQNCPPEARIKAKEHIKELEEPPKPQMEIIN